MGKEKGKPKGTMSAYACFVQVIREEHRKKHPDEQIVFAEFSKKCAEKWKTMSAKEKKRFEDLAATDKQRHDREMATYTATSGEGGKSGKKRAKDPNAPKHPISAFFFFCEDERGKARAAHPEWRVGDVAKEMSRLWALCTNKTKFEARAAADKARYERESAAYKSGKKAK
jgi:hypothetical protein